LPLAGNLGNEGVSWENSVVNDLILRTCMLASLLSRIMKVEATRSKLYFFAKFFVDLRRKGMMTRAIKE
jgi:hypothetical protein